MTFEIILYEQTLLLGQFNMVNYLMFSAGYPTVLYLFQHYLMRASTLQQCGVAPNNSVSHFSNRRPLNHRSHLWHICVAGVNELISLSEAAVMAVI